MRVLVVEPMKKPYAKDIPDTLSEMQKIVGGGIEAAYFFKEPVVLVCNDEGKINGMPLNRTIYNDGGVPIEIIAGTFFMTGLGQESFESLSPEHEKQFAEYFKDPEIFVSINDRVRGIPIVSHDNRDITEEPER